MHIFAEPVTIVQVIVTVYHVMSVISLLLHKFEVKPRTSVSNNDITQVSMISITTLYVHDC